MDISEFVPTLAELIEASKDWGAQCHWHNQKKSGQNVIRCGNIIRGHDVRERNGLIDSLRVLIRFPAETTTLGPAIPNSLPEIREKLEKVSMWLLCKREHRTQSRKIVRKWCDELDTLEEARVDNLGEARVDNIEKARVDNVEEARVDNVEEARDQPATNDVREELNIRKELNIQDGKKILCHGKKSDGTRCKQPVSGKNRQHADVIIAALARDRDISPTTRNTLFLLAELLMCQRFHQDQAFEKSEEWLRKVQELFPLADAAPEPSSNAEQPSTPQQASASQQASCSEHASTLVFSRTTIADSETPESAASSVFSRAGSIAISTPTTSPPSQRRYRTNESHADSPLPSRRVIPTTIPVNVEAQPVGSRITRSSTFILPPEGVLPKFKPFPPKSTKAVVARIYDRINRPIIPREEDTGHIYGFQRDGESLIKFGYTSKMGIEARIKHWNTKCHQEVKVVLKEYLPHAAKVESLVHAILYRERRREILCNGGKGCSTVHEEWFEVTLERLLDVVELCKRWIRTWPYENGILKPRWVEYIDKLYKTQSSPLLDDWHAWLDIAKFAEGSTVEETVPSKVKEQTAIIITETEIKTELDDTVLADVIGLRQELSSGSRRYTQLIKKLKDENQEEKPRTEYPAVLQVLPLHLHDPFGASVVTTLPEKGRKTEAHPI
jgi:hypothetical protein